MRRGKAKSLKPCGAAGGWCPEAKSELIYVMAGDSEVFVLHSLQWGRQG